MLSAFGLGNSADHPERGPRDPADAGQHPANDDSADESVDVEAIVRARWAVDNGALTRFHVSADGEDSYHAATPTTIFHVHQIIRCLTR